VAVTLQSHASFAGEAMACGERTPLALIDGPCSAGIALGEALTNLLAADVRALTDVRCSANWMVNSGEELEDLTLYKTVQKLGMDLAPKLGVCIPVGKDSMSMKTVWQDKGEQKRVTAPCSLVVSAFAPVADARKTLTPALQTVAGGSVLVLIDLALGKNRLGGSILAQCYNTFGDEAPDMVCTDAFNAFAKGMVNVRDSGLAVAYHDRSDGGLAAAVCEMCFAGRCGADIDIGPLLASGGDILSALFSEELGVVLQVPKEKVDALKAAFDTAGLPARAVVVLGAVQKEGIKFSNGETTLISDSRANLHRAWAETSWRLQSMRDNAKCAQEEYDTILDDEDPGLHSHTTFTTPEPRTPGADAPKVAILREQGINGQVEMAWAFRVAGFNVEDVHMSDILSGKKSLATYRGLVCCGGFSYGDTLGAGRGWARTILHNEKASEEFRAFFARPTTFTLGICNGCQMVAELAKAGLVPNATNWPTFTYNECGQFEARAVMLRVEKSESIFFQGMEGSRIPVAVAHGEGRAQFAEGKSCSPSAVYVDNRGQPTLKYPANPNGSPASEASVCSSDGRVTVLMPHPERVVRSVTHSWHPDSWGEYSPWLKFFANARDWCDRNAA